MARLAKAEIPAARNDHVVHDFDLQDTACRCHGFGELEVLWAWRSSASRMVVRYQESGGRRAKRWSEDLAWRDHHLCKASNGNDLCVEKRKSRVQQEYQQSLSF